MLQANIKKMFDESIFPVCTSKIKQKCGFPAEKFSSSQIDWVNMFRAQRVFGLYLPSVVRGISLSLLEASSKRDTEKTSLKKRNKTVYEDKIYNKREKINLYRFAKKKTIYCFYWHQMAHRIKIPPTSESIAYNWCDILSISCRAFILTYIHTDYDEHQCCL